MTSETSTSNNDDPNDTAEDVIAKYIFKPHLQTGLIQYLDLTNDQLGPRIDRDEDSKRPQITASISLNQRAAISQTIDLFTSGDVIAFNVRSIIRTDPSHKSIVGNFEPNYMPLIEFSQPVPWILTPAIPDSNDRLTPWICLIVLRVPSSDDVNDGEYIIPLQSSDQPFPSIKVIKNGRTYLPLPNLEYHHAWAHVQITTDKDHLETEDIQEIIETSPQNIISRIICPRKLEPLSHYKAFLVPTFEIGRLSGLYKDLQFEGETYLLSKSWDISADSVTLPYYFSWEFHTGERGDFEYLVRLLKPRSIDKRVGTREINTSSPGYAIPNLLVESNSEGFETVIRVEGAMKSQSTKSTIWPTEDSSNRNRDFVTEMQNLLNLQKNQLSESFIDDPNNAEKPVIVPPMYGAWQGSRNLINMETRSEDDERYLDWFTNINLDPRWRMTAGLGTLIVQDQQEALVEAAWNQIGNLEVINLLLNQNQMAVKSSAHLFNRNIKSLPVEAGLRFTSSVHTRMLFIPNPEEPSQKVTPYGYVAANPILSSVFTPSMSKILRSEGPIRKRQFKTNFNPQSNLLERINSGDPAVKPAGEYPPDSRTFGEIFKRQRPSWAKHIPGCLINGIFRILFVILILFSILSFLIIVILYSLGVPISASNPIVYAIFLIVILLYVMTIRHIAPSITRYIYAENTNEKNVTAEILRSINLPPEFSLQLPSGITALLPSGESDDFSGLDPERFKSFAIALHEQVLDKIHIEKKKYPILNLTKLHESIVGSSDGSIIGTLHPRATILKRTHNRLKNSIIASVQTTNPFNEELAPIVAVPQFHQPMYEALRDISQELILPGMEFIPQNTIGLLITNQSFIESFMVGINNAFADEALFREMPVALNGTYFRQFWDIREYVPTQAMITEVIDIVKNLIGEDEYASLSTKRKEIEFQKILREKLKDINYIERWHHHRLGKNINPHLSRIEENLVLIVRGDLFKKYPNTVVYASKAYWDDTGARLKRMPTLDYSESTTKFPIFKGTLPPEMNFLGFDLTPEQAKGYLPEDRFDESGDERSAGWFFILEERIGEPRFGADTCNVIERLTYWPNLCWEHIEGRDDIEGWEKNDTFKETRYIDGAHPKIVFDPMNDWNSNSAIKARILLQKPFRIAIHADDMLPSESESNLGPTDNPWGLNRENE